MYAIPNGMHPSYINQITQNSYYPSFKHSGIFVLDNTVVRNHILSQHRLPIEELNSLITFCYIEGLKEFYKTPFLFRINNNEIDDDIWKGVVIYEYEKEIVEELMKDLVYVIVEQYNYFIEKQLQYKPPYLTVLHIENILVTDSLVCLEYNWEK